MRHARGPAVRQQHHADPGPISRRRTGGANDKEAA
ncbi:hypothetical protein M2436_002645 [Streptomyces sp. HB372]|nr:hypothetical protein [Streptomyces sp. HB372]